MPGVTDVKTALTKHAPQRWRVLADSCVLSASWSPHGRRLAAASINGSIQVIDVSSGNVERAFQGHRFGATAVHWHPAGKQFATAGQDGRVRLWNPATDAPPNELDGGSEWVEHLAWSPSGTYLVSAAGRKLRLWNAQGQLVREYSHHPNTIAGVAWNPRMEEFASACYGHVHIWSPETDNPVRTFLWRGSMLSLAWSRDGRYLCHGNQDSTVHFWIVKSGEDLQMWGYPIKVRELAWDRRSRYLATGGGPQVTIWDCSGKGPANTKPIVLKYHDGSVSQLAYQRNGSLLASGCQSGKIAIWNPGKHSKPTLIFRLPGPVSHLSWSPDDEHLAAASEDGTIVLLRTGA
jgi:WD40 repeat protein